MMRIEGELHVMSAKDCGHAQSADCWCEPVRIYLAAVQGLPGVTKIIEHNDETEEHHLVVLNRREHERARNDQPESPDVAWITRALSSTWNHPTLFLPDDPNKGE